MTRDTPVRFKLINDVIFYSVAAGTPRGGWFMPNLDRCLDYCAKRADCKWAGYYYMFLDEVQEWGGFCYDHSTRFDKTRKVRAVAPGSVTLVVV
jgi:hypothetical protein